MNMRKDVFSYIDKKYKELYILGHPEYSKYVQFKESFIKNAQIYFNEIANKYLPKIMSQIMYIFLIFKKTDKNLIPCIFNIKEITNTHKPILERLNRFIKNKLPYIFNIQEEFNKEDTYIISGYDKDNNPINNDKYDTYNEYKLWYSRYRYGKFFYVQTQYVHTMGNIADKTHGYKNSITLEELIYACGSISFESFFNKLKISYNIRDNELSLLYNSKKIYKPKFSEKNVSRQCNLIEDKTRSAYVFCLYEQDKLLRLYYKKEILKEGEIEDDKFKEWKNSNSSNLILLENIDKWKQDYDKKITRELNIKKQEININTYKLFNEHFIGNPNKIILILMFKTNRQEYIFIYKINNMFYKLIIESNMSHIIDNITNKLNEFLSKSLNTFIIKFINTEKPKLYRVISISLLNDKDYKKCFKINPLILKVIHPLNKIDDNMNVYEHILSSLSKVKFEPLEMLNLYNSKYHIPFLIQNVTSYIAMMKAKGESFSKTILNYEINSKEFKKCSKEVCNNPKINYVYVNEQNCGYNFIEFIDNDDGKIILYIISNNENSKQLGNFFDLDETSLLMLKTIKNLYQSKNYMTFLHVAFNPRFYALHFHIVNNSYYSREYSFEESGSFLIQDMYIDEVINNIESNNNYYSNMKFDIFKSY